MTNKTVSKKIWKRPELVRVGKLRTVEATMVPGSTDGGMADMS